MKPNSAVLLTGATGFVGMEILARYLERTDRPVYVAVRARDDAEADARLRTTLASLCGSGHAYRDRAFAVRADIEQPGMGLSRHERDALAEHVTDVVHSAASVSFSLPLDRSRRINVGGTEEVLRLADLCRHRGRLDRFGYISTAYVAGAHRGEFGEHQLDVGQRFRNPYEQSKFEAERLVRAHADRLPVQIFRPSIVVGDRRTGWTPAFNVLYSPLKAFARGNLSALPARRSSPVDVVPVDYVADAVFELSQRHVDRMRTYHLVAGRSATTVGRLIELSGERLGRPEPVVIPPGLFRTVVDPLLRRRGGRVAEGLNRSRVFFPYFSMRVRYDDRHTRRSLAQAGVTAAPIETYFDRLLDYAVATRWGRGPLTRAEAARRVGLAPKVPALAREPAAGVVDEDRPNVLVG
jgi:thioester reductase-like protein